MPGIEEVAIYMRGLYMLSTFRQAGFQWLDMSERGYRRSWWAMVYCLPILLLDMIQSSQFYLSGLPSGTVLPRGFYANLLLSYPVSWFVPYGFAWGVMYLLGEKELFKPMVLVFNWLTVPAQYVLGILLIAFIAFPNSLIFQFASLYTYLLFLGAVYVTVAGCIVHKSILRGFAVALALFVGSVATQIYFEKALNMVTS